MKTSKPLTLVVGGKGKTGRRVTDRLAAMGLPVRAVSPSTEIPFDWSDEATWGSALDGVERVYLTYYPDLAAPGAAEHVRAFSTKAVAAGVEKIVLLAGRGEPQVHPAEDAVRASGADWTILECSFFMQNFTEGVLAAHGDTVVFPAGDELLEPFIDCDDIADCAVAALTDDRHNGKTYELTGPELLTYGEAVARVGQAQGRALRYQPVTFEQYERVLGEHMPPAVVAFFMDLFRFLLDGHNAFVTDGVQQVLGRPATALSPGAGR